MIEIRAMEDKDLKQVVEIEKQNFSRPWSYLGFQDSIKREDRIYLVATEEERIIGYCGLWIVLDEGEITNVAIDKSYRNRGLGGQLLETLFTFSKKAKVTSFTLEVRVSNKPAIHLYEKLGFKSEGVRKDFYEQPVEDAIIMWKKSP